MFVMFKYLLFFVIHGSIAVLVRASSTTDFFPMAEKNLTLITWAHAVNDDAFLNRVLESDTMMIEADIVMGTLDGDTSGEIIPVMGHPPTTRSDLSLKDFLSRISLHNDVQGSIKKGVKLDFKSIEVFEDSLSMLDTYNDASYPIWLNADILPGPVDSQVIPVDATRFLRAAANYNTRMLSIGWTTLYGGEIVYGSYSQSQVDEMISTIEQQNVRNEVTFPVRAGIAANSQEVIKTLLAATKNLQSTLTIWSSEGDHVDIPLLRQLIFSVGLNRVYLDVPEDLAKDLNLQNNVIGK